MPLLAPVTTARRPFCEGMSAAVHFVVIVSSGWMGRVLGLYHNGCSAVGSACGAVSRRGRTELKLRPYEVRQLTVVARVRGSGQHQDMGVHRE
jgi:hypothetical protein